MLALVYDGGELRLDPQHLEPTATAEEALIAVRLAGICNTDLEIARGYMDFRGVPGHEFVGRVLQAPESSLLGARVVGEINGACGECEWCSPRLGRSGWALRSSVRSTVAVGAAGGVSGDSGVTVPSVPYWASWVGRASSLSWSRSRCPISYVYLKQ